MLSFDEFGDILEEVAHEMPEELYGRLNGGVILLPDEKMHSESSELVPLFILGEYHVNRIGRYINIYYGSFMRTYSYLPEDRLRKQMEHTLKHELLHHLENLAGEKGLEIEDEVRLNRYREHLRRMSMDRGKEKGDF